AHHRGRAPRHRPGDEATGRGARPALVASHARRGLLLVTEPGAGTGPSPDVVEAMTGVLLGAGVPEADVAEAARLGHLPLMVVEHLVLPDAADHDLEAVVEATGLSA